VVPEDEDYELTSFDVVIPTKNSEGTIRECLSALLTSDIPINNIFIIDKGQDSTPKIATEMDCVYIHSEANYCQALRLGASFCETSYFIILDSDIVIHPKFFSRLRPHIKDNFISKGTFYDNISWKKLAKMILEERKKKIGGLDAVFVRRALFLKLTPDWAEGFIDAGGDSQLFQKCKRYNIPVYQDPDTVNFHLVGHHKRYFTQTKWYGRSGRTNRLYHWTHFPRVFVNGVIRSFIVALQKRDPRFIPFIIYKNWMYFWGWLRG